MYSDHENNNFKPCISAPYIITVNNENMKVKPIFVTPSKMSINAQGCTSPKETSWIQTNRERPASQQKGFLTNRFHILTDLEDNSSQFRYTVKGGSHGGVQPCKDSDVLLFNNNAHSCSIQGNLSYNSKQFKYADKAKNTDNKTLSSYTSTLSPPTSEARDRSPYGLKWESW